MCLIKGGVINSYNNGHDNLFYFQRARIGANLLSIICVSAVIFKFVILQVLRN